MISELMQDASYWLVAQSTDVAIRWANIVYDTDAFCSARKTTRLTVPAGVFKVRLKGIDWIFG